MQVIEISQAYTEILYEAFNKKLVPTNLNAGIFATIVDT